MKERNVKLIAFLFLFLFTIFLFLVRTTIGFSWFGGTGAPAIWLTSIVFVALRRSAREGLVFTILVALMACGFTVSPSGLVISSILTTFFVVQYFKNLVLWLGLSYFVLCVAIASATEVISLHVYASFFQAHRYYTFPWESFILQTALTGLVSPPFYYFYIWLDEKLGRAELLSTTEESYYE